MAKSEIIDEANAMSQHAKALVALIEEIDEKNGDESLNPDLIEIQRRARELHTSADIILSLSKA